MMEEEKENQGLSWWSSGQDCSPSAGGLGSIPSQRTGAHIPQLRVHMPQLKILHAEAKICFSQKNKHLKEREKKQL